MYLHALASPQPGSRPISRPVVAPLMCAGEARWTDSVFCLSRLHGATAFLRLALLGWICCDCDTLWGCNCDCDVVETFLPVPVPVMLLRLLFLWHPVMLLRPLFLWLFLLLWCYWGLCSCDCSCSCDVIEASVPGPAAVPASDQQPGPHLSSHSLITQVIHWRNPQVKMTPQFKSKSLR